jgi:hypothetical protein
MELKWKKAATPEEIARVREIDTWLDRAIKAKAKFAKLKAERRNIILRCNVRGHRQRHRRN